jgi:hypothetical protein
MQADVVVCLHVHFVTLFDLDGLFACGSLAYRLPHFTIGCLAHMAFAAIGGLAVAHFLAVNLQDEVDAAV